ncbi:MAG TPA: hypothetical protein VF042_13010 [Gemmatimonadaceae bacterium]
MQCDARIAVCVLGLIAVSACSNATTSVSAAGPAKNASGDVVVAPRMVGSNGDMKIRSVGSRPSGTVEVPIDANGRPDIFGIRYTGTFSEVTRRDLADYIAQARFSPAMRNGVPERGIFTMTFR